MGPNFTRMLTELTVLAAANIIFMAAFFFYKRARKGQPLLFSYRWQWLTISNSVAGYFKGCTFFAAACFVAYMVYKYTGITCEDLDKRTQCACYALEAKRAKPKSKKIEWATKGMAICPDSDWFPQYIQEQSSPKK